MMRAPLLLLKEGDNEEFGNKLLFNNILACCTIAEMIKSTLGPRGMDKLIQDERNITITNDGATIMKLLNVVHPVAKLLTDISHSQDMQIGDGTTTVVLLAAELLRHAKELLEDGVDVNSIISVYYDACEEACHIIDELKIEIPKSEITEHLRICAETTLSSKVLGAYRELFPKMVVEAVRILPDPSADYKELIGMKKITGGSVTDSFLIEGVAFCKTFSYAGFEQQPKLIPNPKLLLLNMELELKAEKENAEIRVSNPHDYIQIVDAEWNILYRKMKIITDTGVNVVLSKQPIGDLATQFFADRNVFCAGRVDDSDLFRVSEATGGKIQSTLGDLCEDTFGRCGCFEEIQIGDQKCNVFRNCIAGKSATIILRGGSQHFLDEAERSLNDALMVTRRIAKSSFVLGGAGSIEMEVSKRLRTIMRDLNGKEQHIVGSFAKSLEVIPRTLAQNSGYETNDIMNTLRQKHASNKPEPVWFGIDCIHCNVIDTLKGHILEPAEVKTTAIKSAAQLACSVLAIDETIQNGSTNAE